MTRLTLLLPVLLIAACSSAPKAPVDPPTGAGAEGQVRPMIRPIGLGRTVPKEATTAEQFDVTTEAERKAAAEVPAAAEEAARGLTIASLGDPSQPGFWMKTPLVEVQTKGRVVYPGTGKSVQVDLIPIDGTASAGSRLSLAAFRVIEAPLTELPEVEVFSGG